MASPTKWLMNALDSRSKLSDLKGSPSLGAVSGLLWAYDMVEVANKVRRVLNC